MSSLTPVDQSLLPFWPGEMLAFTEAHHAFPGMYGRIRDIGVDVDGVFRFDLVVIDPQTRDLLDDEELVYRAGREDIQ